MAEPKTAVASIRMPAELMDQLAKMAEEDRRPVAMMARVLLEEAIEARTKTGNKRH